jgi:hypothetical protein
MGERLREADHAPLGRGIRRAQREAQAPGERADVHQARVARAPKVRHGKPRAVELPGEVDGDAAVPFGGIDLLDASRGPRDAGVVHETIQAAQLRHALFEKSRHFAAIGDVAAARRDRWIARLQPFERWRIDVAHVHLRAFARERPRDREADSGRARGHHHPQSADFEVHLYFRLLEADPHTQDDNHNTEEKTPWPIASQFHAATSSRPASPAPPPPGSRDSRSSRARSPT